MHAIVSLSVMGAWLACGVPGNVGLPVSPWPGPSASFQINFETGWSHDGQQAHPHHPTTQHVDRSSRSLSNSSIVRELVEPSSPIQLTLNDAAVFHFRTRLDPTKSKKQTLDIYLARIKPDPEDSGLSPSPPEFIKKLGQWTISAFVSDYFVLWTPKPSDGIPVTGGSGYLIVIHRPTWWGWRGVTEFTTDPIDIRPAAQGPILRLPANVQNRW